MYTREELDIVDYIENETPKSMDNVANKVANIKLAVIKKYAKLKVR